MSHLGLVSGKSERRAARSVVADYHDAQLGELVVRVGEAIYRWASFQVGEHIRLSAWPCNALNVRNSADIR